MRTALFTCQPVQILFVYVNTMFAAGGIPIKILGDFVPRSTEPPNTFTEWQKKKECKTSIKQLREHGNIAYSKSTKVVEITEKWPKSIPDLSTLRKNAFRCMPATWFFIGNDRYIT